MSDREAMKEALRLLTKQESGDLRWQVSDACDILRARLAAPRPEPVAFDFRKAFRRAFDLGQLYGDDADRDSRAAHNRADKYRQEFDALRADALAHIAPPAVAPEPGFWGRAASRQLDINKRLSKALIGCVEHMEHSNPQGRAAYLAAREALRTAPPAAAPRPEPEKERAETDTPARRVADTEKSASSTPEVYPEKRHPGYVIGNHWLETAYERLCAGEAEDAILEDYELVREPRLRDLRLNDARYKWLKSRAEDYDGHVCFGDVKYPAPIPDRSPFDAIDSAIDAAMGDKT
jgi:hypothetical protein